MTDRQVQLLLFAIICVEAAVFTAWLIRELTPRKHATAAKLTYGATCQQCGRWKEATSTDPQIEDSVTWWVANHPCGDTIGSGAGRH